MVEVDEENWDDDPVSITPAEAGPQALHAASPSQDDGATLQPTLKITDGYKFSYEANVSPANVDGWIELSYSNGKHQSRFQQQSYDKFNSNGFQRFDRRKKFNSGGRPPRNWESSGNDDFNSSQNNLPSRQGFGAPKPSNGSMYQPNNSASQNNNDNDENWDDEPADKAIPSNNSLNTIGFFNSNQKDNQQAKPSSNMEVDEENWDDKPSTPVSQNSTPGGKPLGFFNPNNINSSPAPSNNETSSYNGNTSRYDDNNFNDNNDKKDYWKNSSRPTSQNHRFESRPRDAFKTGRFVQNNNNYNNNNKNNAVVEEENWDDEPSGETSKADKPTPTLPFFNPSALLNASSQSSSINNSLDISRPDGLDTPNHTPGAESTSQNLMETDQSANNDDWEASSNHWENSSRPSSRNHRFESRPRDAFKTGRFVQNNSNYNNNNKNSTVVEEENWDDEPSGETSKADKPTPTLPFFNPSALLNASSQSSSINNSLDDSRPDDLGRLDNAVGDKSTSQNQMETLDQAANDDDWLATSNPIKKSYENNWHSNKYGNSRNFNDNNRFGQESSDRNVRENYRHRPYDRGNRRGGRGRGGNRGGRGSWNDRYNRDGRDLDALFDSRDRGRNENRRGRGNWNTEGNSRGGRDNWKNKRDVPYREGSFNDRPFGQLPESTVNNARVEPEEDWDTPTGTVQTNNENNSAPPQVTAPVALSFQPPPIVPFSSVTVDAEENWD